MGSFEYDSDDVRAEALKFKACCEQLDESVLPRVKNISANLEGKFAGQAANALNERLNELVEQIRNLRSGCSGMHDALKSYAEKMDRTDRELSKIFG